MLPKKEKQYVQEMFCFCFFHFAPIFHFKLCSFYWRGRKNISCPRGAQDTQLRHWFVYRALWFYFMIYFMLIKSIDFISILYLISFEISKILLPPDIKEVAVSRLWKSKNLANFNSIILSILNPLDWKTTA